MRFIKNQVLPFERMTRESLHNFYGYYDLQPWSKNGNYHLCTRVEFYNRLQTETDFVQLGFIRMYDNCFIPVAHTSAWNFQQGAMLQWNPAKPDEEILYNIRSEKEYKGIVKNINSGKERTLSRPIANVDPTGRFALSINFRRMFDFRPGYGYAGINDTFKDIDCPDEDGIFLINLETGESKLIISLYDVYNYHKGLGSIADKKIVINHITFNTDGTRFIFLARYFAEKSNKWGTAIFTANTDGSDLYCLNNYSVASHYCWCDNKHILIYADMGNKGKPELYLLRDMTDKSELVNPGFFREDGHCSYSTDKTKILYDSYPDDDGYRYIYLYDIKKRHGITLVSLYSDPKAYGNFRCDLHPRWNRKGNAISFDSTHEGHRHIYWMELEGIERLI